MLESFKMASNGFVFRPGRGPSFILVGLVVIVIILFYSYWGVSSKNNKLLRDVSVLQDRLRVLAARKLTSDKKGSALVTQLTQMQDEKEKIEDDIKSRDSDISEAKKLLQVKEDELAKLHTQEKLYQEELEKLRKGVNGSSSELKKVKEKAVRLVKKYGEIKANHSSLQEKISKLTVERDNYKEELLRVKLELAEAKKAQAITVPPPITKKVSEKTSVIRESIKKAAEEGNDKLVQEKKVSGSKKSDVDEEEEDNKNTDLSEEGGKEVGEMKTKTSMVKDNFSKERKITSPSVNISSNVPDASKQDGNKTQSDGGSEGEGKAAKEDENDDQKNAKDDDDADQKNAKDEDKEFAKEEEIAKQPSKRDVADDRAEKEIKDKDEVNDGEEKDDDEADEALDNEEEVRRSMDSPVLPHPGDTIDKAKVTDEGRQIPDDIKKSRIDMMQMRLDPHGMLRDIPNDYEKARKPDKDSDDEMLPNDLI